MFCILHITDLHRSRDEPISNAELLSALLHDRNRYVQETPAIAPPQAIIVSGDMIQGVGLGHAEPDRELAAQYDVAYDFLAQLTDRFVGGDRSKVILIPGNHDVDWNQARSSMEVADPKDVAGRLPWLLYEPESPYRWDWQSREVLIVKDHEAYRNRLAAFWTFFERFYAGSPDQIDVAAWRDANLFSMDDGRIGLAAFNSCARNDCFSFKGEISSEAIAQSDLELTDRGPWRLRIAVWHHDIEGSPSRTDYMDPETVRGMIGRGFRIGLYGHQHRAQVTPQHIFLPEQETMAIASTGSLCAGRRDLPTGARRGYSLIEIADDYSHARFHVREMAFSNLFSRANLPAFGGRSYVDLEWTPPLDAAGRPEDPVRAQRVATVQMAEAALYGGNAQEALHLLDRMDVDATPFARRLKLEALQSLRQPDDILAFVSPPASIEELVIGVDICTASAKLDEANALLKEHGDRLALPAAIRSDIEAKIQLAQRMKK